MAAPDTAGAGGWFKSAFATPYGGAGVGATVGGSFPYRVDEREQVVGVRVGAGRR